MLEKHEFCICVSDVEDFSAGNEVGTEILYHVPEQDVLTTAFKIDGPAAGQGDWYAGHLAHRCIPSGQSGRVREVLTDRLLEIWCTELSDH